MACIRQLLEELQELNDLLDLSFHEFINASLAFPSTVNILFSEDFYDKLIVMQILYAALSF
jgi:hypothetical protein